MKVIWKYPIQFNTEMFLPPGAVIRHFCFQSRCPYVWVEVCQCTHEDLESRFVSIIGTGRPIGSGAEYIGTAMEDAYVWHCYEVDG